MEFEIRQLAGETMDEGLALARAIFDAEVAPGCAPGVSEAYWGNYMGGEELRKGFAAGDPEIFAAYAGDRMAGVAAVSEKDYILFLGVEEAFRRQGIGTELLHCVYNQSMLRRAPKMNLDVPDGAVGFYEGMGFTESAGRYDRDGVPVTPMEFDMALESPWQPWEEDKKK